MAGIIRIGDRRTAGGVVPVHSAARFFMTHAIACLYHPVTEPEHGDSRIAPAMSGPFGDGIEIAQHNDLCKCTCDLISSLPDSERRWSGIHRVWDDHTFQIRRSTDASLSERQKMSGYRRVCMVIAALVVTVSGSAMLTACKSTLPPGESVLMNIDSSYGRADRLDTSALAIDGRLTEADDGRLYWTSPKAGTDRFGAIFRMTKDGHVSLVYSFNQPDVDAAEPINGVFQASDGNFYGTTHTDKNHTKTGTLFRLTPGGKVTILHTFGVKQSEPQLPNSLLVEDHGGTLYGTTIRGGPSDSGAVYRITRSGEFSVLHFFEPDKRNGAEPGGDLTLGFDGNLYGTTRAGGKENRGTLYRLSRSGEFTVLHSFAVFDDDGQNPGTGVVQGKDGSLYGTTAVGGQNGSGTIFRFSPSGKYTIVYSFPPASSIGVGPSSVVVGSDGYLYGTTCSGGTNKIGYDSAGQFYRVSPHGEMTSLYSFGATSVDGTCPSKERLVVGKDGYFYGVTFAGGSHDLGTVYRMVVPK
ncbi:choice-of-anchor tandem repeat GloVer-containing protein [Burkholderia glumae]|uniref:choice-of-anchor tandem repeat GloVer-containing protein n=2 Tax=Burkholderia glumae TaxID=337 RepID=UPI0015937C30|nr:choice-of-anchor tandem repeat GloVer-containing protein [Burkholderia glumae]MCM2551111.1 PAAR domain-containing protein [Burkholderia glumae]NVE25967.1 PAAR domain-containing protein [Burkholderia glumae]